jgi:hypothetical protein
MGIFPSVETLLGQGLLLGLFIFAVVKTFWPRRAVVLPTIPAGAAIAPVGAAEGDIARRLDQLERRLEAVERVLSAEIRPG